MHLITFIESYYTHICNHLMTNAGDDWQTTPANLIVPDTSNSAANMAVPFKSNTLPETSEGTQASTTDQKPKPSRITCCSR